MLRFWATQGWWAASRMITCLLEFMEITVNDSLLEHRLNSWFTTNEENMQKWYSVASEMKFLKIFVPQCLWDIPVKRSVGLGAQKQISALWLSLWITCSPSTACKNQWKTWSKHATMLWSDPQKLCTNNKDCFKTTSCYAEEFSMHSQIINGEEMGSTWIWLYYSIKYKC